MARPFVERSYFEMTVQCYSVQRQHFNHWIRISLLFHSFSIFSKLFVCIICICPNVHSLCHSNFRWDIVFVPVNAFIITDLRCDGHSLCTNKSNLSIVQRRKRKLIWALIQHKRSIYFLPFGPQTTYIEHVIISKGECFLKPDWRWRNKGKFNDCHYVQQDTM